MAIKRGESKNIIVGAAAFFVADEPLDYYTAADITAAGGTGSAGVYFGSTIGGTPAGLEAPVDGTSYGDTLEAGSDFTNVGYTMNGLEVQFQPDFGEVQVDQLLDVAKLYKQGMQVNMATAFAEATLENLLVAIAGRSEDLGADSWGNTLDLVSGDLGECPVERAIVAVGPGTGDCSATGADAVERIYVAHRALSIDNVTVSAKRDEPSMFEVSFRLLPASNGSYGKIVDRTVGTAGSA